MKLLILLFGIFACVLALSILLAAYVVFVVIYIPLLFEKDFGPAWWRKKK